ncbi:MotA/TolQ/ExbB proton channel family protein [Campylobacter canadensis]|uniref:MotA/TolQ/ExbB proton channel family protein n=1 Tax=Campylobacter canadensis TaxID=449520 RepID=UPI0015518EAE|nr:MotA/TolQ/ExbB proton channel family protein [Campylobacter canadensis]MBZ7994618.1 MotA/TolQ/ExbB proton channel family protein [Campylobacter canadensis]
MFELLHLEYEVDIIVFSILAIMNALSIAVMLERVVFYCFFKYENYKSLEEFELSTSKNLIILSIIAQNAPYIGLLGTVFGIMMGFNNIDDTQKIISTLSAALKATAGGLVVAIIALVLFNIFDRCNAKLYVKYKKINNLLSKANE